MNNKFKKLKIKRPDDWHTHVREGEILHSVLPFTTRVFGRFLAMPNTQTPITTEERAWVYRQEITTAMPLTHISKPMIPCYLTDDTSAQSVIDGYHTGAFFGAKYYPVGVTTNSLAGVTNIKKLYPVFEAMQKYKIPLMIHGEVIDHDVDIYDRERVFIERYLSDLIQQFPSLTMTMEHITTIEAVDFIFENYKQSNLAGSITLHHLLLTRNDMLANGLHTDLFCYPLPKASRDRTAIRRAAVSGLPCYFLGTDSAPHPRCFKHVKIAKAGIFSAPYCLEGYATVFEMENKLDKLEYFSSIAGANHYHQTLNSDNIYLIRDTNKNIQKTLYTSQYSIDIFVPQTNWSVIT